MTETPAPKRKLDIRNLAVRLGTTAIFGVLFLTLVYYGAESWSKLALLGLLAMACLVGMRELTLMGRKLDHNPSWIAGTLAAWALLLHFHLWGTPRGVDLWPLWAALGTAFLLIHFGALLFDRKLESALPSQAETWLGALVLGLGLGFQQKLFMVEGNRTNTGGRLLLALYIITWFGDSAAYFAGSLMGRHKLAPKVSPKKTWEGSIGNFLGNIGGAFLMKATVCPDWTPIDAMAIGLLLGLAGQMGDLVESTWKRSAGVKDSDSGLSIPGHGGVLDRADSLFFTAPVLFAYVHFVHGLG